METPRDSKLNNPFMALRHKNFRLYWMGMCVSLIGSWMQNTAQPWLAYSLTNSALLLSLVGILQFMPMLLFSLFAGVVIDRFPKKKILMVTQFSSLVVTLGLASLVWSGHVQYWHILVAAAAVGIINTLDMPARQAFVIEMVGKEDLMNAIALNSTVFNIARILGPALAGLVMAKSGVASCFYINSLSFAAVVAVLFFIKPVRLSLPQGGGKSMMRNIKDGLLYIGQKPLLQRTLLSVLIVAIFAMNFNVLVPVFAKTVLHQKETGFGFLMSFMGVGSFFGAIFIAAMSRRGPKHFIMTWFPVFVGVLLVFTGCTKWYGLTALCLAVTGFFFVAFYATANSTVQYETDNAHRGRVMSVYNLVFSGSTPLGNFYTGLVTERFGAAAGFVACGGMILALLILLYLWKWRRKAGRVSS